MRALFVILLILSSVLHAETQTQTPRLFYIKPKSTLTTMDGKTSAQTSKGIYAHVAPYNARGAYYIVFDKNKKPAYTVPGEALIEISKDIELLPNISAETIYPPPSKLTTVDKEAFFDTQFNVHFDSIQFNNIYSDSNSSSTIANRFELRTLYSSPLPVNFEFALNYELASWNTNLVFDDGESPVGMKMHVLSIGPHFQHFLYDQDGLAVSLLGGIEYAPYYELSSEFGTDKYSGTLLDVGVEMLWGKGKSKWSLGSHYRRHEVSLKSASTMRANSAPDDITLNSFGLMAGYKYEWDL